MSATTDHDIRAAMRPLVAPVTGSLEAGTVPSLAQEAALPSADRRLWLRNMSASATIGFALLPTDTDGSTLSLGTTFQIPPGQVEKFSVQGGLDLWLVSSEDATEVSALIDDVSGA